ncbi:hypothetical protein HDG34_005872 [Paraburkholderia sp. HC6.4b]|uniref:hypothetical protein n=1 Tax=unclassified Paraburkholderia TaxID=2615204 RepID=UPI00161F3953|nr:MULTISPECIES: hypothetical protein [unclassified Paraburkholderia]MBB5411906.1 hypothetical protein [Paraburkholderia sp. HC6.4b]MBB5450218.1 hypothetical protein [Paraburkholderia sp. Kb1A]
MKLSKALGQFNLNDTVTVEITPGIFSVDIVSYSGANQEFNRRLALLTATYPNHQVVTDNGTFIADLIGGNPTDAVVQMVTEVLISNWSLKDDDGNDVPFTVDTAVSIIRSTDHPGIGRNLMHKLVQVSLNSSQFRADWEDGVAKN